MNRVRKKRGWVYLGALALLATALCFLWAWSQYRYIYASVGPASISVSKGKIMAAVTYQWNPFEYLMSVHDGSYAYSLDEYQDWSALGFAASIRDDGACVVVPLRSMLLLVLSVLSATTWQRYRHYQNIPLARYCPACNYDLRGSKGLATCPECGEAIPTIKGKTG